MLGALIGDMAGSIPKELSCWPKISIQEHMTSDSVLCLRTCKVLLRHYPFEVAEESAKEIQEDLIHEYVRMMRGENGFWGRNFYLWFKRAQWGYAKPYGSFGVGAAIRAIPIGWLAKSEVEIRFLAEAVAEITHNSEAGFRSAEATATAVYWARNHISKEEIKKRISASYYGQLAALDISGIETNRFPSQLAEENVVAAFCIFFASPTYEETIEKAASIGGHSLACLAGALAEAYYQPDSLSKLEEDYLYWKVNPAAEECLVLMHETIHSPKLKRKEKDEH